VIYRAGVFAAMVASISALGAHMETAALLLSPGPSLAEHQGPSAADRQTWKFALPRGRSLALEITVGDVRIIADAARTDAQIELSRTAPSAAALARISPSIAEGPDEVVISAVQKDHGTDPALRTDVTVRVPSHATLRSIRIVEGQLSVAGLTGSIQADVRRGPVTLSEIAGTVRVETGIGAVTAQRARLVPGGLLRLRAFNGNVRLELAERPVNARILALALNGTVRSDIPLTTKDQWGPRWGETTLGDGEPVISLDVVTGDIEIRSPRR
jgi:hypothetical protein